VEARKFDEILKVEAKYRHFDTFSNDPTEDAFVLYAMGCANDACSPNETCCLERASYYYEKAKERIEDADANDQRQKQKAFLKSEIGIYFALLYSKGRDMKKAISFHRWFLCKSQQPSRCLSDNFNRFDEFEYTIEVMEGSIDMMKTFAEQVEAEDKLITAYIGCDEFLKAKAANVNHSVDGMQSGRIEYGLCNHKAAIAHFRKGAAELQKEEMMLA
jgi:hypothetical protein